VTTAPFQTAFGEAQATEARKTIPFDYAFRFNLKGELGNVLRRIVTVSIEATFVAVAIGYGVLPKLTPIRFGLPLTDFADPKLPKLREISLDKILKALKAAQQEEGLSFFRKKEGGLEAVLKNGIKLNPEIAERLLLGAVDAEGDTTLDESLLENLFQVVGAPPEQIQFLYALFDDGSGREFQSAPILNTAGLGSADGDRPFRYFARPISFAPRSTIRMEITERSDFPGDLHVSLIGYKILGEPGTPTERIRQNLRRR